MFLCFLVLDLMYIWFLFNREMKFDFAAYLFDKCSVCFLCVNLIKQSYFTMYAALRCLLMVYDMNDTIAKKHGFFVEESQE